MKYFTLLFAIGFCLTGLERVAEREASSTVKRRLEGGDAGKGEGQNQEDANEHNAVDEGGVEQNQQHAEQVAQNDGVDWNEAGQAQENNEHATDDNVPETTDDQYADETAPNPSDDVASLKLDVEQLKEGFSMLQATLDDIKGKLGGQPSQAQSTGGYPNNGYMGWNKGNMPYGPYWYGANIFGPYGIGFHSSHHKAEQFDQLKGKQGNYGKGKFNYIVNDSMQPTFPFPMMPFH